MRGCVGACVRACVRACLCVCGWVDVWVVESTRLLSRGSVCLIWRAFGWAVGGGREHAPLELRVCVCVCV